MTDGPPAERDAGAATLSLPAPPRSWERSTVLVAGLARSGSAAARALQALGAHVIAVDSSRSDQLRDRAAQLAKLGVDARLGDDGTGALASADLVVASPGWPPASPLLRSAASLGIPVWSEVQLALQLRGPGAADWLVLTGTNGKTTTIRMLTAMLQADGHRAIAAGNVGVPIVEVVTSGEVYDVLAVELSSAQLHFTPSMSSVAAAVLNVAPDHLDWHGSYDEYVAAKAHIYDGATTARIFNADDEIVTAMVTAAPGSRPIGFTLDRPEVGSLGIADGSLVDRAFDDRVVMLAAIGDVQPAAPHNVANALAAAALARAYGVSPDAVRAGLLAYHPDPHRIAYVATIDGVDYIDDSKATNPHAAAASLAAYSSVVWIAGGLAKGADFDQLVASSKPRLRAAVLLGQDRAVIRSALARHAPDVPVVEVVGPETGGMQNGAAVLARAVSAATALARPGDTVLLAPACASWDMFTDYGARGDAFAAVTLAMAGPRSSA